MDAKRRRRFWSGEEKRRIVAETYEVGASVSIVARRHDVNANLVFTWRRDPRFNMAATDPCFLPVTVSSADVEEHAYDTDSGRDEGAVDRPLLKGVEIAVGADLRLRFAEGITEPSLARLVQALRGAA
jgi:transposase